MSTGIITTIAGTGTASYSGDNGDAVSATLKYPFGVVVDLSGAYALPLFYCFIIFILLLTNCTTGNVYIGDEFNQRVRKVTFTTGVPSVAPSAVPTAPRYDINHHLYISY